MRWGILSAIGLAALASIPSIASAQIVIDGGFDTQGGNVPDGGVCTGSNCPTGPWVLSGSSGFIAPGYNDGAFGSPVANSSPTVAYLQRNGSVIQQTITVPTTGRYVVNYWLGSRPQGGCCGGSWGGNQTVVVTLAGQQVAQTSLTSGAAMAPYSSASVMLSAGVSYTLAFTGTDTTGDNTAFVDSVSVALGPIVDDGGFDVQGSGVDGFCSNSGCPTGSWVLSNGAGLIGHGYTAAAWGPPTPVSAPAVAYLQGGASSAQQAIVVPTTGRYVVRYSLGSRSQGNGFGGNQTVVVTLAGKQVAQNALTSGVPLSPYTSSAVSLTAGISYTLSFTGTTRAGDNTAFVDNVSVGAIPSAALAPNSTTLYSYDALGRLTSSAASGGVMSGAATYIGYDSAGNRSTYKMNASSIQALRAKLAPYLQGRTTPITIVTLGNSHGTGQGTSTANQPGEQLKAVLQSYLPGVSVAHRNYAVPGSWQAQVGSQIDQMNQDGVVPDIVLILDPGNDGLANIYNGLESPIDYRRILGGNIQRLRAAGAVVLSHTTPLPHPTRSLASGRFDYSPDFFLTYPQVSWVSFDNFQTFTYNASAQTITSSVQAQFTYFSPGWVAPGRWMRLNDGEFYHINAVDSTGTTITVDNGSGGPAFSSDHSDMLGMRIGRIDSKTQLVPARNEDDLSRPAGVAATVPLALERRDLNGNGVLIYASTRHLEINQICREVTAQNGAVLVDWGAEFQKLLTSDSSYDSLYPNNDDLHPGDQGYQLLTPLYRAIVGSALF